MIAVRHAYPPTKIKSPPARGPVNAQIILAFSSNCTLSPQGLKSATPPIQRERVTLSHPSKSVQHFLRAHHSSPVLSVARIAALRSALTGRAPPAPSLSLDTSVAARR